MNYFKDTVNGAEVLKRLSIHNNTVMRYHDYELYGEQMLLENLKDLGHGAATLEVIPCEPDDLKDKMVVNGHKLWVFTPILPTVIINLNEAR